MRTGPPEIPRREALSLFLGLIALGIIFGREEHSPERVETKPAFWKDFLDDPFRLDPQKKAVELANRNPHLVAMLDRFGLEFPSQLRWIHQVTTNRGLRRAWQNPAFHMIEIDLVPSHRQERIAIAHSTREWNGSFYLEDAIRTLNELTDNQENDDKKNLPKGEKWDIKKTSIARRVVEKIKADRRSAFNLINIDVVESSMALPEFVALCAQVPDAGVSIGGRGHRWYNEAVIKNVIDETRAFPGLTSVAIHFDDYFKKAYINFLGPMIRNSPLILNLWRSMRERRVVLDDKWWLVEHTDPATTTYDLE